MKMETKKIDEILMEEKEAPKKKIRKTAVKKNTCIEMLGKQIDINELETAAEAEFKKRYPDAKAKEIKLYINIGEGIAYYVVDGKAEEDFKIVLDDFMNN